MADLNVVNSWGRKVIWSQGMACVNFESINGYKLQVKVKFENRQGSMVVKLRYVMGGGKFNAKQGWTL
jgi:hypothetical protein